MSYFSGFTTGLVIGALAMFVFDPKQGRRRRTLARKRVLHYGNEIGEWRASRQRALSRPL
jgi:gas vesicle protein